jgi:signal transduction histidine kinase/CheY-like chemotaxis protein/HPt (histidine-containing phosphotransfer) domain-containing protein
MKSDKIKPAQVLRQNYREIIFVFLAFTLMALAAYFSVGRILRGRLLDRAEEMISAAEANVRAGLYEAENTLLNSSHMIISMLERNASRNEILDYLATTTAWVQMQEQGLMDFRGLFGYINGEFYDSAGINSGGDIDPQTRPWYLTAQASGSSVGYTAPYRDSHTGDTIVSAALNISTENNGKTGILVLDININWMVGYVGSLAVSSDGYGILLSQNLTLMAHQDTAYMGYQLDEIGGSYEDIANILRDGLNITARRIIDINGDSVIIFFNRIFNGWYVGIVIPYYQFYRDMYISAITLILVGLALSLILCSILLRFSWAKMRADQESKSKSTFLASMSHEIRTPMNAIIGITELLLRGELSDEARMHAQDIKQAGNNLISIINDILDFSKIEAGKLEIVPVKYLLASLINDTVNIIRMRIGDKPLRFFSNIDSNIPSGLIGDDVRLRQILLNLLTNAVKYSEKGYISLTITLEKKAYKQVMLKIVVTDTGRGIRQEDMGKLFDEFVQVDMKRNHDIEGTGLGLTITKKLCDAMGGSISVESEYGKGSSFTVILPQGIDFPQPFAAVENAAKKKVLVYEGRAVYAQSVCWSLRNMGIRYKLVSTLETFFEALFNEEWTIVFSGYGLYDKIKPVMEKPAGDFPGGNKPPLALMVEWGTEAYIPNIRFVSIPVQSLSIANVLNGKPDSSGYTASSGEIRFAYPQARILVVDDITTNLKVAEGLLAPYKAEIDTCLSGEDALEMIKQRKYDLVFMDHMMPEMDGIEVTAKIREWEAGQADSEHPPRKIPVVMLTANAVVGMREMFIENGLDDFLAKPIDITKLDEMLDRWISKEKRERRENLEESENGETDASKTSGGGISLPAIPGVDIQRGIAMTGGTVEGYIGVLSMFCKDAGERLDRLQTAPSMDTIQSFVTQVHAIKSASAAVGAAEVSTKAAQLESAGKAGELALIVENLGGFTAQLSQLIENIRSAIESDSAAPENTEASYTIPQSVLSEIEEALVLKKPSSSIFAILDELNKKPLDLKTKEILEKISDQVLMAEFQQAIETVKELVEGLPAGLTAADGEETER